MQVITVDHPLVQHKLGLMRTSATTAATLRQVAAELGTLLGYEATRDLSTHATSVTSWSGSVTVQQIRSEELTLVPVLRAGLGMVQGLLHLFPGISISLVGMSRDEKSLRPLAYFQKLVPELYKRTALVVDIMLATGGSISATVDLLKYAGCRSIKILVLIAAPEGVAMLEREHPDITLYTASVDNSLNKQGFILPGLGDAGDRLFGTE